MKRLTQQQSAGYDLVKMNSEWCTTYCNNQPVETCNGCAIHDCIQKLAEYENMEESGLLQKLPCKIGTTVYQILIDPNKCTKEYIHFDVYESTVTKYIQDSFYLMFETITFDGKHKMQLTINSFGETVFLDKKEAEIKSRCMR